MTHPTPLKLLTWLATLLVTLYVLYLLAANTLLASDWARSQLDRPRFSLSWERAWTLFPGQLSVTELTLAGATDKRRYALEAESATLGFALIPLLQQSIRIRDLNAEGIRQAELDGYHLEGRGALHLRDLHWRSGELAADEFKLTLDDGSVLHDDTALVESVALDADLSLAPLTLADYPGNTAARFISGTLELAGHSDAYAVFTPYLADLGWLEIAGHGTLAGELTFASGEVQPGSHLRLDSPQLSVRLDERDWLAHGTRYHIRGAGAAVIEVDQDTRLTLALDTIEMFDLRPEATSAAAPHLLAHAEGFRLELASPALTLHEPPNDLLYADMHWRNAVIDNVAGLNHYLPAAAPLILEGGSARLQGGLTYAADRLSGGFDLSGEAIALRLGEQPLTGRLSLALPIGELDAQRGTLDISDTRLEVEATAPGEAQPLTTTLELPKARFHSPLAWQELDEVNLLDEALPWTAALELHGRIANLSLLNPFLTGLLNDSGLALQGGGQLDGTLHIEAGAPQVDSRLEVRSEALGARLFGFQARGDGWAQLTVQPGAEAPEASVALEFHEVDLTRLTDMRRFFQAERLTLAATVPAHASVHDDSQGELTWHNARIPDVSVLNEYLPQAAPLRLHAGTARSAGQLTLKNASGSGYITLRGSAINGRLLDETFHGEVDATLALREFHPTRQQLDAAGSRLEVTATTAQGEPLHTLLVARQANLQGGFDWPGSDASSKPLGGTLRLDGLLDRLGFLNAFLPEEHGLALQGGGRLSAELHFANGEPQPGSQLHVHSQRLGVHFLHYEAFGDGSLALEITDPGAQLHLSLPRFGLRRQSAEDALIEGQLLEIHSQAQHFELPKGLGTLSTEIAMPHVAVPSLATLNDYLPQDSGIELLSGQALITTQLQLEGMNANGQLQLHAPQARLALDEQILDGELTLQVHLANGDLETLEFDVSGSQLSMNQVRLTDDTGNLTHGWWARLNLPEGRMRWVAPLELDARLDLAMRDSGLLVNLFIDAARERRWLRNWLTLGEVQGEARVLLNDDTIRLENLALQGGGRLELLANLALRESHLLGRAFARYGPLQLGIEVDGEQRRWQLRNAREWYLSGQPASELTLPAQPHWYEQLDARVE